MRCIGRLRGTLEMSLSFQKTVSQLDLALDHLAQSDEDSARFALMLVDNVMELALHGHAQYVNAQNFSKKGHKVNEKLVRKALGRFFEDKVKFAKKDGAISPEVAKSILHLHDVRNLAYHQGIAYEETIRSLTIFYFKIACNFLQKSDATLSTGGKVPYRAEKYFNSNNPDENAIWAQLEKVAGTLRSNLLGDLIGSMTEVIEDTDRMIEFCVEHSTFKTSRNNVVRNSQQDTPLGLFSFFSSKVEYPVEIHTQHWVDPSIQDNKILVQADPIPEWMEKLQLLLGAKNDPHAAVGIYCEFMEKTADIREKIGYLRAALGLLLWMQKRG
ncbi:MAG: hypothetical protein MPK62_06805 [Alphaproteobacteria bacterium]|nr:hypothetical protein [Alphaproteobacteria bacterium]